MKKKDSKVTFKYISNIIYPLISLGLILVFWIIASAVKNNPLVLPMPDIVFSRFFALFGTADFWKNVVSTLLRTGACFIYSFIAALILAASSSIWKPCYKILNPIVSFFRAAPTVAVILIMYAFLKNTTLTLVVGFLIAFPVLYSAFTSALNDIRPELKEMATFYQVRKTDQVCHLYLPSIASCIFDTSRTTISLTFKIVVAAEILTAVGNSIGNSINIANLTFEIAYLLAWTLVAIMCSYLLELIVFGLKKVWETWR